MKFEPKIREKRWSSQIEEEFLKKWQKETLFKFDKKIRKPVFSIDTPPPYVNTPVHIGHAYTYVIQDAIARFKRMTGFNVLFPIGLDKNGLPIEVQAEKTFKIDMHTTPREEFLQKCKQLIEQSGDTSLDSFKRLGLSCNSWKTSYEIGGKYDTDDPEYRKLTQETFINFYDKGLIYEDIKPTNYCPVCRTTISDAEVEYDEKEASLNFIKFKVKETGEEISIATTRPELLCTCKIILFNPADEKYKKLEGKHAEVPIFKQEVMIKAHPYAKMEFGTGLVMMCSFGDQGDVRLFRELNLKPVYAIDEFGRMNKNAGKYNGQLVMEARENIIQDLKSQGQLDKQEKIIDRKPLCWRSKNPVEFVPMKEFYLKQIEFKDELLKIAKNINFFAPDSRQFLIDWINSITIDWVISRRRYYGTEIPLWYCKKCNLPVLPKPGKYHQPWKEQSPVKKCKCGSTEFIGEMRVFDTWFDSSSSVLYILGYLWDKKFFEKNFPCTLRPQGREIIRTWLYFTLLKSFLMFKKKAFENCYINMYVVDEHGEKMSKSLGNVVDPQEVIKRFGAESFRIWDFLEGDIAKNDIRCSFERIQGTSKFLTKLWNISRYISMFPTVKASGLTRTDKWILGELGDLVSEVKTRYESYSFYEAANLIRDFVWNLFASHYLEMTKARSYGQGFTKKEQQSAWFTLHTCLKNILLLLAPLTPFITDFVWRELYSKKSIHVQNFPKAEWKSDLAKLTLKLVEFNSKVWEMKKSKGLSLKDEIEIKIPKELKIFEKDLKSMHKLKI